MTYRRSLFADGRMLLGIESKKSVDAVTLFTKGWFFSVIPAWQTKGLVFGMFCDVLMPELIDICIPFMKSLRSRHQ